MALRQSVVLGRYPIPEAPGLERLNVILWIPITVGQEEPLPGFVSAARGAAFPAGAAPSAEEVNALRAGQIREVGIQPVIPATYTQAQAASFIGACRNAVVAAWVSPGRNYGAYQDENGAWQPRPA